ncbi:MAG: hypothetical protein WBC88_06455 [Candidatus Zixiibacteriota bacterium]
MRFFEAPVKRFETPELWAFTPIEAGIHPASSLITKVRIWDAENQA